MQSKNLRGFFLCGGFSSCSNAYFCPEKQDAAFRPQQGLAKLFIVF